MPINEHNAPQKFIIFFVVIFLITVLFLALMSCSVCPPAYKITNGEALRKHDKKKFRATIIHQGNVYLVTYRNMQETRKEIYLCKPTFKSGSWVLL
ncbi:MAG: hypothetical protein AABY22_24495 [Nanoarchaeota archaeon]